MTYVLGIETSCDETAVAIIDDQQRILGHALLSQGDHALFGGVVPEVAARAHLVHLQPLIHACLAEAQLTLPQIDVFAVTCGPGLIGGLMVGVMMTKAMAAVLNKPFVAVNHLAAHVLMPRLTEPSLAFPYLVLLVSGGHCQLVLAKNVDDYELLGETLDDAAGECLDKCAKMMGLGYPGGPLVEQAAREGDLKRARQKFQLPVPLQDRHDPSLDLMFSFSGLKSAVQRQLSLHPVQTQEDRSDLCCLLQEVISQSLRNKVRRAIALCHERHIPIRDFVIAGGVAANATFRQALEALCQEQGMNCLAPPIKLCTDNGVMIAWAGLEFFRQGLSSSLEFKPRPRWPLAQLKEK